MSTAQVEQQVLEVLRTHNGAMPARDLSASLEQKAVSDAQRREALLNLVTKHQVKIASGQVKVAK